MNLEKILIIFLKIISHSLFYAVVLLGEKIQTKVI